MGLRWRNISDSREKETTPFLLMRLTVNLRKVYNQVRTN